MVVTKVNVDQSPGVCSFNALFFGQMVVTPHFWRIRRSLGLFQCPLLWADGCNSNWRNQTSYSTKFQCPLLWADGCNVDPSAFGPQVEDGFNALFFGQMVVTILTGSNLRIIIRFNALFFGQMVVTQNQQSFDSCQSLFQCPLLWADGCNLVD